MAELILEDSLEAELLEELQVSRYKSSSSKRSYRNGHYQRKQVTHPGHSPSTANPSPKPQKGEILGKKLRILRDNFFNCYFRGLSLG
jgi:hypothetical protein